MKFASQIKMAQQEREELSSFLGSHSPPIDQKEFPYLNHKDFKRFAGIVGKAENKFSDNPSRDSITFYIGKLREVRTVFGKTSPLYRELCLAIGDQYEWVFRYGHENPSRYKTLSANTKRNMWNRALRWYHAGGYDRLNYTITR